MKKVGKDENKVIYEIAVLIAVIFLFSVLNQPKARFVSVSFPGGASINAEVVDTPYEIEKGLMFRQKMLFDSGMLFAFDSQKELKFWMKNTLMPLDMIFISENLTIVNIVQDAQPCTGNCMIYSSVAPAKYVIEANAGFVRDNGIEIGDRIRIR